MSLFITKQHSRGFVLMPFYLAHSQCRYSEVLRVFLAFKLGSLQWPPSCYRLSFEWGPLCSIPRSSLQSSFWFKKRKLLQKLCVKKSMPKTSNFPSLWQFSEWNLWSANKLPCLLFLWKSLKRGKTTRYWYIDQLGLRLTKLKTCSQECPQLILARSWYDRVNC